MSITRANVHLLALLAAVTGMPVLVLAVGGGTPRVVSEAIALNIAKRETAIHRPVRALLTAATLTTIVLVIPMATVVVVPVGVLEVAVIPPAAAGPAVRLPAAGGRKAALAPETIAALMANPNPVIRSVVRKTAAGAAGAVGVPVRSPAEEERKAVRAPAPVRLRLAAELIAPGLVPNHNPAIRMCALEALI